MPGDRLLDEAGQIARQIAAKSPTSVQLMIQTANAIEDMSLRDGYRYEQDMTAQVAKSDDAKEARQAFLEKARPGIQGQLDGMAGAGGSVGRPREDGVVGILLLDEKIPDFPNFSMGFRRSYPIFL